MYKRTLALGVALLILFAVGQPGWAAPKPQARSIVTYPADGMTISGIVEVTGIATHPNMNFYQLRYAAGPRETGDSQWVDFAIVEGAQVENDVLGTWDTTVIPDGQYTLALAVWGVDDPANYVFFVRNLTVNNAQPVETPTPETPTPEPMPTAVVGPSPTPIVVEQPATPTPRPSPTPQGGITEDVPTPTAEGGEEPAMILDVEDLRAAFCTGGLFTVVLLSLWALYVLVKAGVRWFLRGRTRAPGD
jgi:hypothetical protein